MYNVCDYNYCDEMNNIDVCKKCEFSFLATAMHSSGKHHNIMLRLEASMPGVLSVPRKTDPDKVCVPYTKELYAKVYKCIEQ